MGSGPCCQVPVHSRESGWILSAGVLTLGPAYRLRVSGSLGLLFVHLTGWECEGSRLGCCASCFLGMGAWLGDAALGLPWCPGSVPGCCLGAARCGHYLPATSSVKPPVSFLLSMSHHGQYLMSCYCIYCVVLLLSFLSLPLPSFPLSPSPTYLFLLVTSCPPVWSGSTPSAV